MGGTIQGLIDEVNNFGSLPKHRVLKVLEEAKELVGEDRVGYADDTPKTNTPKIATIAGTHVPCGTGDPKVGRLSEDELRFEVVQAGRVYDMPKTTHESYLEYCREKGIPLDREGFGPGNLAIAEEKHLERVRHALDHLKDCDRLKRSANVPVDPYVATVVYPWGEEVSELFIEYKGLKPLDLNLQKELRATKECHLTTQVANLGDVQYLLPKEYVAYDRDSYREVEAKTAEHQGMKDRRRKVFMDLTILHDVPEGVTLCYRDDGNTAYCAYLHPHNVHDVHIEFLEFMSAADTSPRTDGRTAWAPHIKDRYDGLKQKGSE